MKTTKNEPIWYIAGIGALGSLLAGHFCHGDHSVKLLLKNEDQLTVYQNSSLSVISDERTLTCHPQAIHIEHLNHEPIQYLICCVKSFGITKLLMRLKQHLNENSIIILIHNGLGVLDEIKTELPQLRIIHGISTLGAYVESPFTVRAFLEGKIYLGPVVGHFTPNEIHTVCSTFKTAQLPYQWEENIHNRIWEKFALNCIVNILTAIYACKNGDLLLLHREVLKKLAHEVAEVMNAYDINTSADELFHKATQLINITADNYSSMYKDVQNNLPTELHYLNEHLVLLAQQKNMSTPVNNELLNQFYEQSRTKYHDSTIKS